MQVDDLVGEVEVGYRWELGRGKRGGQAATEVVVREW